MMKIVVLSTLLSLSLAGCANLNSIHRDLNTADGSGALIDIKQRAILVTKVQDPDGKERIRICTEPSPDALSAYAIQLAAEGKDTSGQALQLALNGQEGASYVGLRTQSIQVMRDSMFRICEAYVSDAIDKDQFEMMLRRSQKIMVALLGIEQLTGVVKAPQVIINASGIASASRPATELREEIKKIDTDLAGLKKKEADAKENQKADIKKDIEALESDKKRIEEALKTPGKVVASGSVSPTVVIQDGGARSDKHIQAIAADVKDIVMKVIETADDGQMCFAHLKRVKATDDSALTKVCAEIMAQVAAGDRTLKMTSPR